MASFFSKFDSERIVEAISAAEGRTSAELRVHVTRRIPEDLDLRALRRFHLLGMAKTEHRNGVLIYIAPRARKFRILGDEGIHAKAGDEFWKGVASVMEAHFRKEQFTEGVILGVGLLGEELARHFPRAKDDKDELPNTIDEE
ncbi:MAG TPA: TPM domain-containing protein [Thermoanaerobaculia bacterium]|jgi:uncharacterized membrane protein